MNTTTEKNLSKQVKDMGIKINIKNSKIKPSPFAKGNHTEYKLILKNKDNKQYTFTFHDSVYNYLNCKDLNKLDAIYSIVQDAYAYECTASEEDFLKEYGYYNEHLYSLFNDIDFEGELVDNIYAYMYEFYNEKDVDLLKQGIEAYHECFKTHKRLNQMFTQEELEKLQDLFQDY